MIQTVLALSLIPIFMAFWTGYFGVVTELPYGLDTVLLQIKSQVDLIITTLPPLATIWNVFIIALGVKFVLLVAYYVILIFKLIKP